MNLTGNDSSAPPPPPPTPTPTHHPPPPPTHPPPTRPHPPQPHPPTHPFLMKKGIRSKDLTSGSTEGQPVRSTESLRKWDKKQVICNENLIEAEIMWLSLISMFCISKNTSDMNV